MVVVLGSVWEVKAHPLEIFVAIVSGITNIVCRWVSPGVEINISLLHGHTNEYRGTCLFATGKQGAFYIISKNGVNLMHMSEKLGASIHIAFLIEPPSPLFYSLALKILIEGFGNQFLY
jgi:hypothetical protein